MFSAKLNNNVMTGLTGAVSMYNLTVETQLVQFGTKRRESLINIRISFLFSFLFDTMKIIEIMKSRSTILYYLCLGYVHTYERSTNFVIIILVSRNHAQYTYTSNLLCTFTILFFLLVLLLLFILKIVICMLL